MKAKSLWISASVLALSLPVAALAQQSDPRGQVLANGPAGQPGSGTQPAQPPGRELQEVIVTASKIEANVQKVPIQVQTLSGEELLRSGVTQASDLNKLAPGVQVTNTGGGTSSLYIRGIGSAVLNAFGDPANAFSVDGVYFSRSTGPSTSLFDVARVEILKGPQGTLYGRNATGGAFNVITNRPTQALGGDLSVEIGDYQERNIDAAVNVPVSSTLAMRVAGHISRHDGYFTDGYDDDRTGAVRASLLWKPTDKISVYLSGDYAHVGGKGLGSVPVGPGGLLTTRYVVPGDPRVGPSDPRIRAFIQASARAASPGILVNTPTTTICLGAALPFGGAIPLCSYPLGVTGPDGNGFTDNDTYGANLTVDADIGIATLTAIGGYRGTKTDDRYAIDATTQAQQTEVDQYSGELRLASNDHGQPVKWLVGGFYLKEKQDFDGQFGTGPLALPNPQPVPGGLPGTVCLPANPAMPLPPGLCATTVTLIQDYFELKLPNVQEESYAAFGQATLSFTERLRMTGGLRYTHDRKSSEGGTSSQVFIRPAGLTSSYPSAGETTFKNVSGRIGAELDVAPRSMAYISYSTAYHTGGLNLGVPQGPNVYEYKPEHVKSYNIGIKNRFFGNTLQLNLEAFLLNYIDLQTPSLGRINDGSIPCSTLGIALACPLALRTDNAGKVRFRGFEGEAQWRPWRGGLILGDLLFNDSRYIKYTTLGQNGASADYSGRPVNSVVKWTATGGISQEIPIGGAGYMLIPAIRSLYKSGTSMGLPSGAANYQKAYTQTDVTVTFQAPERRWSIGAFVRNLEDHTTLLSGGPYAGVVTAPYETFNPPRTYGVFSSLHF